MSKTDHSRIRGTHRAGHMHRENAKERDRGLYKRAVRPYMTTAQAIAEGMADLDDTPAIDVPGLKKIGPIRYATERRFWSEFWGEEPAYRTYDDGDEPERMAAWEIALLDGPEGAYWTEVTTQPSVGEYAAASPDYDEDDEPGWDRDEHWLAHDPDDFFQAVGDGWLVEGPSLPEPSIKASGYVRVHELAREIGINAKHLVEYLRLEGEYVASHSAYVAVPVADVVRRQAEGLVAKYGPRKRAVDHDLRRLSVLLASERRAKIHRPGAPRPGVNPFLVRSN